MLKIYFEDDSLNRYFIEDENVFLIDAGEGPTKCYNQLKHFYDNSLKKDYKVLTNSELGLHYAQDFAWNAEKEQFEVYLCCKNGIWKNIHELTNRVLRRGHNIWKLWWSGEFFEKQGE